MYIYKTQTGHYFTDSNPNLKYFVNVSGVGYFFYEKAMEAVNVKNSYTSTGQNAITGTVEKL